VTLPITHPPTPPRDVKRLVGVVALALTPTLALAQDAASQPVAPETSLATNIIFYILAIVTLVMGIMVVSRRNPLQGALSLVASFFCLGGIYALLYAHLLAAMQILVYAGAIMVLFTFVIMLLNLTDRELGTEKGVPLKIAVLAALVFIVGLTVLGAGLSSDGLSQVSLANGQMGAATFMNPPLADTNALPDDYGSVAGVGKSLYTYYLLPFELVSVLLLVAIVGAVAIAKKRI
jgi:NADH-quinone oxidoreductase subunit J